MQHFQPKVDFSNYIVAVGKYLRVVTFQETNLESVQVFPIDGRRFYVVGPMNLCHVLRGNKVISREWGPVSAKAFLC